MEISIFTSGYKTLIGRKTEDYMDVREIESRIIFQDPDLVYKRLLMVLDKQFGIRNPSEIKRMIFGISAGVDSQSGTIIHSYILNELAHPKGYIGFSFKDCFGPLLGRENIYLTNDAVAVALGFSKTYPSLSNPVLSIMIDNGVGVCVINNNGDLIQTELGSDPLKQFNGRSSHTVLSDMGLDELFYLNPDSIMEEYTRRLISICSHLKNSAQTMLYTSRPASFQKLNICLWSTKSEYIDHELLKASELPFSFTLSSSLEERLSIPIVGLFSYPDHKPSQATILRVEYYSAGEKIYDFEEFEAFRRHWKDVKAFANPDNEYRAIYSDGVIKPVKMRDFNYEKELEAYRF